MKILTAVDLSRTDPQEIVSEAAKFAKRGTGVIVDLVYACVDKTVVASRQKQLSELLETIPSEVRGSAYCVHGDPISIIADLSVQYDLLIVGPREPQSGVEKLFLGSIAVRSVRTAKCALLVARPTPSDPAQLKALVGVDLNDELDIIEKALPALLGLNAKADLLHVDQFPIVKLNSQELKDQLKKERERYRARDLVSLKAMLSRLPPSNRGAPRLADGEPGAIICDYSFDYDLIVVASQGKAGVTRFFLGSVAEEVVSKAGSSVLVLPYEV